MLWELTTYHLPQTSANYYDIKKLPLQLYKQQTENCIGTIENSNRKLLAIYKYLIDIDIAIIRKCKNEVLH